MEKGAVVDIESTRKVNLTKMGRIEMIKKDGGPKVALPLRDNSIDLCLTNRICLKYLHTLKFSFFSS